MPIFVELIAAIASLLLGGVASSTAIRNLIQLLFRRMKITRAEGYSDRLALLTESLVRASSEVDALLLELRAAAKDRANAVMSLEADLVKLESEEKALQERVKMLQSIPLPVAEHFAALTEHGERRNARRDYALFGAGVVVSTAIAILLKLMNLA